MTEENYRRTMHFNPQCLFLARGEQAYQRNFPEKRLNLTQQECDRAYQCMKATMDWIGTTDRLQNETMALLHRIIPTASSRIELQEKESVEPIRHDNTGPKIFGLANISNASLEYFQNMTRWDEILYGHVQEEYNFEAYDFGISDRREAGAQ